MTEDFFPKELYVELDEYAEDGEENIVAFRSVEKMRDGEIAIYELKKILKKTSSYKLE